MTALYPLMLEAALRALLAAAAVWAGLRMLRMANVVVLKAAWALVLVASIALPMAPGWLSAPAKAALKLPAMPAISVPQQTVTNTSSSPTGQMQVVPYTEPRSANVDPDLDHYSSPAISDDRFGSASRESEIEAVEDSAIASAPVVNVPAPQVRSAAPVSTTMMPLAANRTDASGLTVRFAKVCLLLYLVVASALLLRLLLGLASAIRLWMTAEPISVLKDPSWSVRCSERVASPVNIGSGIVLPEEHSEWDEEKLRIVLALESAHIRQGDFYLQMLAGIYACIFWFSPLGWWLKRKLYELGEAISDRAGLEEAASRTSYAQLLLEFAALPRPTLTGVAMARTSHLSQRIERLLNESSFRQAFAVSGRRGILALVLVPLALLTVTSLVSVQAAVPLATAQSSSLTGQSTPEQVTDSTPAPAPAAVQAPSPVPEPAAAPEATPAPPAPAAPDNAAMPAPPAPAAPATAMQFEDGSVVVVPDVHMNTHIRVHPQIAAMPPIPPMPPDAFPFRARDFAFAYGFGQDGDPYAVVGPDGKMTTPHGWYMGHDHVDRQEEIEKARKQAHGEFLWFQHDGKSYIVDDPGIVSQIDAMNKPMLDLQSQMNDLGKQMRALGEQQREKARTMRDTAVQTPDLTKQLAALKAAEAALQAKQGGTITQKDLGDLQREIGKIQGELGSLQGKLSMDQGGFGRAMGEFGAQLGMLGGEMGMLGGEMGRFARENHEKVKGIISDSLSNGKAKQVQ
jgi:beta-lactamase regulating signal transducer with metallopeptidase domain